MDTHCAANVANELNSIGLQNESWHGSTANVLISNEFDNRSEHIKAITAILIGRFKRRSLTCTSSSCDRFCSSWLRLASSDPYPCWKKKAHRRHTCLLRRCCMSLKQRYSTYIVPSRSCGDHMSPQSVKIFFASVFSVFGSGFRVPGRRWGRRRRRLQRKDRMYGFARQAWRVPSVRTVPGERPARREQNPTSLLGGGREQRWCYWSATAKSQQLWLLVPRNHFRR